MIRGKGFAILRTLREENIPLRENHFVVSESFYTFVPAFLATLKSVFAYSWKFETWTLSNLYTIKISGKRPRAYRGLFLFWCIGSPRPQISIRGVHDFFLSFYFEH